MARAIVATCNSCGWRRASITMSTSDMRGQLRHKLDLCACARGPFCVIDGSIVAEEEVAAHVRQTLNVEAEKKGPAPFDMAAFAAQAAGIKS